MEKCNHCTNKVQTSKKNMFCRGVFIIVVISVALSLLVNHPAISQDLEYHNFADSRSYLGIPNRNDVLSNLFFILAGVIGLRRLPKAMKKLFFWRAFYYSIILVGLGSGYYHLAPTNATLIWDRIPMTLGFASLISLVFIERINELVGKSLFIPLLLAGVGSVIYWYMTELSGVGDLRPYIAMQFLPMLMIPMLLLLFPKPKSVMDRSLWFLFIGYGIAKVCEMQDIAIYERTLHLISGHTLKHASAALGILFFHPTNNG